MQTYLNILILTLIGGVTAFLARERGRDPIFWFFIGILFSVFGLITLLVMPDLSKEANKEDKDLKDMTTNKQENLLPKNSPATPLPLPPASPLEKPPFPTPLSEDQWFYMDYHWEMSGPWTLTEFAEHWRRGEMPAETMVWNPNLEQWTAIAQLKELQDYLNQPHP